MKYEFTGDVVTAEHMNEAIRRSLVKETNWKPERKVAAAAVATVLMFTAGLIFPDVDYPTSLEAAVAVLVAYLIPN